MISLRDALSILFLAVAVFAGSTLVTAENAALGYEKPGVFAIDGEKMRDER
ncbi:MAG: hypothetical protein GKS00_28395 [Alphaproteobacteria bacterium]|nr:hypothetical protein [Alphaproteobacteria bacterium]